MNFKDKSLLMWFGILGTGSMMGGAAVAGEAYFDNLLDATAPEIPQDLTRDLLSGDVPLEGFALHFRTALAAQLGLDASSAFFDDSIIRLPSGKVILAGNFIRDMVDLQTKLKPYGENLLSPTGFAKCAETVLPKDLLNEQAQAVAASIRSTLPSYLPPEVTTEAAAASAAIAEAQSAAGVRHLYALTVDNLTPDFDPIPVPTEVPRADLKTRTRKDWQVIYGDPKTLEATANANFVLSGSNTLVVAEAKASAVLRIFSSQPIQVLQASAVATAPKAGDSVVEGKLWVAGTTLFDETVKIPAVHLSGGRRDITLLNVKNTFRFSIGPIPMSAVMGAQGAGSLTWEFHASALHASASLTPGLNSDGYAEVGADIFVARLGVGGQLTLVELSSTLVALADLEIDDRGDPRLITSVTSKAKVSLLKGSLYAFAEVPVPVAPFTQKFTRDLYNWEGVSKDFGNTVAFKKVASPTSVEVQGDAEEEDYVAGNLDTYETTLRAQVLHDLSSRSAPAEAAGRAAISSLEKLNRVDVVDYLHRFEQWQ